MLINIEHPITITHLAQRKIAEEIKEPDINLRLGIKGGGCSGLSYNMEFVGDSDYSEGDTVLIFDEFEVYLDPKSIFYLKDVTLDYQEGLMGRGFIFNNPQATNSCGCGESFSL